jgi:SpoIID/LytB domain protein
MRIHSLGAFVLAVVAVGAVSSPSRAEGPSAGLLQPVAHASREVSLAPETGKPRDLEARQKAQSLRVQIFPHIGKYVTPQGRESVVGRVTLVSTGECRLRSAAEDPAAGPTGAVLSKARQFGFEIGKLAQPAWVDCDRPAKLVRELPLKSYSYEGSFHVSQRKSPDGRSIVRVVNVLPMEKYLRGVVPSEVLAGWPDETLRAQAVAARTYAYYYALNPLDEIAGSGVDLDDTVFFQAYTGLENVTARTDAAVVTTAAQVATYDGRVLLAYFSADCGGYTEDAVNVWGVDYPYNRAKREVFDPALTPKSAWSAAVTPDQMTQRLRSRKLIDPDDVVRKAEVNEAKRNRSGRATTVLVTLADGSSREVSAIDFQFALKLRSTLFAIRRNVIEGRGYGHGVGMSQWGAKALAETGWEFSRIVEFYYSGSSICEAPGGPASVQVCNGL